MDLAAAIENLYATFAAVPLDPPVEGCHCCVLDADVAALAAAPLRELDPALMSRYAQAAVSLWGTVPQFKHLLPRLFEVLAADALRCEPEIALKRLRNAEWETWPGPEQAAVRVALQALWEDTIATYPARRRVGETLCAIGCATDAIEPFLDACLRMADVEAAGLAPALALPEGARSGLEPALAEAPPGVDVAALRNLAALVDDEVPGAGGLRHYPYLRSAFWEEAPAKRVVRWLASDPVMRFLERAFLEQYEEPWADEVAACHDQVTVLRRESGL